MTVSSTSATVSDQLHALVTGRTVVLATADPTAGESMLRHLRELGADHLLVLGPPALRSVAAVVGAELVTVELDDEDPVVTRQCWTTLLADPPPGLRNLVDARDPDHNALLLVSPGLETAEVLGRPVFGAHRPGWATCEETLLADRLWEAAGVPASE